MKKELTLILGIIILVISIIAGSFGITLLLAPKTALSAVSCPGERLDLPPTVTRTNVGDWEPDVTEYDQVDDSPSGSGDGDTSYVSSLGIVGSLLTFGHTTGLIPAENAIDKIWVNIRTKEMPGESPPRAAAAIVTPGGRCCLLKSLRKATTF